MITIKYGQITLPPLEHRWFVHELLQKRELFNDGDDVPVGVALLMWTYQLLCRTSPSELRRTIMIQRAKDAILGAADTLEDYLAGRQVDACQIALVDGRFFTYTGCPGWLDLTTGESLEELPAPGVGSTAYNLLELFRRRYRMLPGGKHAGPEPPSVV